MAGAAIFVAAGAYARSPAAATVILAGGAGSLYLGTSAYWAISADLGGPSSGSLSGFMNMGGQIGGAVTSILTPLLAARLGWTFAFLAAAAMSALGAAAWMVVNPNRALVPRGPISPARI